MSTNRSLTRLGVFAFGLLVAAVPVIAQSGHVLVPADQVQWAPAPPVLPAGAEIAVLEGNPSEAGPVTMRLRLPAQYDVPAHWHSMTERVTVLSGTFHVGMGDKLDRNASQTLSPGGFVSLPAKMHHFAWTSAPTIVQINLQGPFDLYYVNPADNPQKSLTKK
jgi:quercetin dioxygenase-like cupin family protein